MFLSNCDHVILKIFHDMTSIYLPKKMDLWCVLLTDYNYIRSGYIPGEKKTFSKAFFCFFSPKKWYTFLVIPPSTNATGSVVRFYNAFIVTSSKWLSGDIFRGILQGELAVLFPQRMKRSVVQPQKVFSFTNQNSNCMIEYMCLGICDSHKLSLCIFKMPPQNKRMSLFNNTATAESL